MTSTSATTVYVIAGMSSCATVTLTDVALCAPARDRRDPLDPAEKQWGRSVNYSPQVQNESAWIAPLRRLGSTEDDAENRGLNVGPSLKNNMVRKHSGEEYPYAWQRSGPWWRARRGPFTRCGWIRSRLARRPGTKKARTWTGLEPSGIWRNTHAPSRTSCACRNHGQRQLSTGRP